MPICGIYKIENSVNGKIYIGQSRNLKKRLAEHKRKLKNGNHSNTYLQKSWEKHGSENFIFKIIEECIEEKLDEREIYFIKKYKDLTTVYNFKGGGSFGTHSEATKELIREKRKLQIITEEAKQKMRIARREMKPPNTGKTFSEEHKKKISETLKGRPSPMKGRLGYEPWNKGIPQREETKFKISESGKGRIVSEETKIKLSKSRVGIRYSEESKKKISDSLKGQKNPKSKLTNKDVTEIKTLLNRCVKCVDIARRYSVSPRTISNIKTGASWSHINIVI